MPSVSRYRTWLAVPADEIEDLKKAHPPMNGHTPVIWDKEHKLWFARPGADLSRLDRWLPRPQDVSMNGSDPVTEFAQVLENAGLVLKELPVMDGKIHRVPTADDKKGQKSGAYRGFLDGRPAGWYRDYRSADDSPITWTFSGGEQTDPRARLHLKAHSMQRREDAERELKAQYNRQAAYARRYVNKWPQATAHEYLTRKGIQAAPGVRVNNKNELVIPFSNRNGAIRSYQRIPVTGGKDARILKDSEKTGNWFALGTPRNGQPVLFAEGYATAASLHEATGLPVLMTVDGGNMIAVAENARQKWTQSPFIFCADNDHAIRVNKGIVSATKAAELTGGTVIFPAFTDAEKAQGLTDFNDLDASRGRAAFQHVINAQLEHIGVSTPNSNTPEIREALVIGNLVFTPVHTEEKTMTPTEYPETSPDTGHSHDQGPSLPSATQQEQPAASSSNIADETQSFTSHATENNGKDERHADNVQAQTESSVVQDSPAESPASPESTTASAPDEPAHPAEPPEKVVSVATDKDWREFEAELSQPEKNESQQESGTSPEIPAPAAAPASPEDSPSSETMNESAEPSPSPDAVKEEMTVMTEPDDKQSTGISPDTPREEAVNHVTEDIPLQPEPFLPESDGPEEYENYSAYQELMNNENPEHLQENGDMPSQPDTDHVQADESELQATTDTAEPAVRDEPTPQQPVQSTSPSDNTSSFLDKARGFFTRKKTDSQAHENSDPTPSAETTTTPPIPDSIVYAPERSDAPISLNMDEILKELDWEKRADRTVLYKLDGKPAFIDRVNRLEMVNGASNDDRSVLAALAVATKFYGGVIELTGSDAFKQKAMQLIIEHNIDVRMKLPDQRAELEKLRKEMAVSKDAVVTHKPTPELNRNTPEQPAVPDPVQEKEATQSPASPVAPEASTVSTVPASSPAEPGKTADAAQGEEPPGKLRPGESVTAVLHNFGRAEYAPGKGESFFVELKNRSGSKLYWGEQLESLVKNHQKGDVVTLTLQNREQFILPGEQKARFRNKWSMESVTNGISVSHDNPDKGQRIQAIPVETFMKVAAQISQGWPEEMKTLRMPENVGSHLFIGEDRHPVSAPQNANQVTEITSAAPDKLTPVLGSVDKDTRELNLLLVQSADEHLQGVVRLNGTLYPALATPSADNSQLVINALTDKGLRFAGYGEAVNHDADSTNRPAPELMQFHLKTREEPLFAAVYTPEKQPDALYRNLGFEQSWQQWSNSQKPEDRQEKTLHQDLSHSPGR
ncbi:DNA primase [Escherichia coli]|nr:DNA primase [Escherichia coli]